MPKNALVKFDKEIDSSIYTHEIIFPIEVKKEVMSNLKIYLSKIQDNKVKNLVNKTLLKKGESFIKFGVGSTDARFPRVNVFGGSNYSTKLNYIIIDIFKLLDDSDKNIVIRLIRDISTKKEKVNSLNTRLSEKDIENNINLKKEITSLSREIFDYIDYNKMVHAIYEILCIQLINRAFKTAAAPKLFELVLNTYSTMIEYIVKKSGADLDENKTLLLNMITDYLFTKNFTDIQSKDLIDNLFNMYTKRDYKKYFENKRTNINSETKEVDFSKEVLELFRTLDYTKYNKIEDLSYMLAKGSIVNITPTAMQSNLQKIFGINVMDNLNSSIVYFTVYLINLKHNSVVPMIKDEVQKIEDFILNFQRDII